jgi:hypothetical protein
MERNPTHEPIVCSIFGNFGPTYGSKENLNMRPQQQGGTEEEEEEDEEEEEEEDEQSRCHFKQTINLP